MPTRQAKAYSEDILLASAARTTSSNVDWDGFADVNNMSLLLEVTAQSGTSPTLNVAVEGTYDGTTYVQLGAFSQLVAAGRGVLDIGPALTPATNAAVTPVSGGTAFSRGAVSTLIPNRIRLRWVIGGTATPTFTFSVRATSEAPQT